jgi:hypothetical protein
MPTKNVENIIILSLVLLIFYMMYKLNNENEHLFPLNPIYRIKSYRQKNKKDKDPRPFIEGIEDKSQPNDYVISRFDSDNSDREEDDVDASFYLPSPVYEKVDHPMTNFNLDDNDLYAFKDPADNVYPREEVNKYLDEYMNYSRFDKVKQNATTRQDVDKYRAEYIDFRNKIQRDSHGFDPVDEMNLDRLNPRDMRGENIADIYDRITAKNFDVSSINYVGKDITI